MKNILLIDPNPITSFDIYIHLEDDGYRVFGPIVTDGEAIKMLKTENISTVILDEMACKNRYPDFYNILMQSDVTIVFLTDNKSANDGNKITYNKNDDISSLLNTLENLTDFSKAA